MTKEITVEKLLSPESVDPVEAAKATLREHGYIIPSLWQKEDIRTYLEDNRDEYPKLFSKPEHLGKAVEAIAKSVEDNWDASVGVNWEVIGCAVDDYYDTAFCYATKCNRTDVMRVRGTGISLCSKCIQEINSRTNATNN